ncbi:MAG TPA: hypothetical protein VMT16_14090 [Thermoanaerobaculia bacterium]|nr:hypothetical protein [Thermoanaerobaculia bacterium]
MAAQRGARIPLSDGDDDRPLIASPAEPQEDEYAVISAVPVASALSLLCFAAALGSRFLVAALPAALRPLPRPFLSALLTPAAAALGLLLALLARHSSGGFAARAALFANATALVLSLLLIAVFFFIFPGPLMPR